jgi:Tol biopolymer transport system component/tRNA A-37 threonylcarbamoyl transferase component Bud32
MLGTRLTHFHVLEKIGEGGMGSVYKARDEKLSRLVALKVLRPELLDSEQWRRRFLREAHAAATVTHPNIATIHDVGEQDGTVYLVMEFVEGKTLRALLHRLRLPLQDALRLGTAIAEGLAAAHQSDVVHCDLKPENVVVGPDGQPKILDFGLAKLLGARSGLGDWSSAATATADMSRDGRVLGTPAYMSPEQARGEEVDARTDVFSFGAVLYELVTGTQAFARQTWAETLGAVVGAPTPSARAANSNVLPELEWILGRCLEKSAADRYQDTGDLVLDLRRLQRQTSVHVGLGADGARAEELGRTGLGLSQWRFAGRRRVLRALLWPCIALVLVGIVIVATWVVRPRTTPLPAPTLRTLTANSEEMSVFGSSISPDGKRVALYTAAGFQLIEIDTGETQTLPPIPGEWWGFIYPQWFPDGERVIALGRHPGMRPADELWSVSLLTGAARQFDFTPSEYSVSPDGSWIAVTEDEDGEYSIWLRPVHGGEPKMILSSGLVWPISLTWSPDGKRLLYSKKQPNRMMAWESCDLEGQDVRVLPPDPRQIKRTFVRWLADGRIVYARREPIPRQNEVNLWAIRVDPRTFRAGGSLQRITDWRGVVEFDLSASADGKRLTTTLRRMQRDVYVGELRDGQLTQSRLQRLTFDDRDDYPLEWSPDGTALFFSSDRGRNWDIYRQGLHDKIATAVVTGPANDLNPVVSSDGRFLLYLSYSPGDTTKTPRIMRMPLSGGPSEKVTDPRTNQVALRCPRRPGAHCILAERVEEEYVFLAFDPVTGRGRELMRFERGSEPGRLPGVRRWDLSPDGEHVAVLLGWQIHIVPVGGGPATEVHLANPGIVMDIVWSPDGQGFFVKRGTHDVEASWLHVDTSVKVRASLDFSVPSPGNMHFPRPSPDGKHLALVHRATIQNVTLIEDF